MPFSSKSAILGHFWPFKNSKQGICTYKSLTGRVHTIRKCVVHTFYFLRISSPNPFVGKCPKCGNNIVLKKSFYGCSNYPECKFTLAEHFRKKKLTKTNVKELLEGKETLVKGIKNKEKKPYNAVVKIGEKGYIDFISFSK